MMNKSMNLILEGLHDDRILEAMSKEDIKKIDVNSIKPEKKDLDRAEGLKFNGKKFHGDGSPWSVSAGKMAKLIKDPMKLVRRSKAVRQTYGDTYSKDREADVWSPFREALVNMGFTEDQISEIEGVKIDKSVKRQEVKKTISVDDKPKGWTPFDEGFKSGDKVQIYTDSDGWFGEYEFVRKASDKDFIDLHKNYLKDSKGKKYVIKNVHKGMFFGDLDIVTDNNIRKVQESEDFVVDYDLSDVYMVSLDWSPKTRSKSFKDYDKAEAYAIKSLKSSLSKKTVVPSQYKRVTIAKGNQIIKVLSAKDL